MSVKDALIAARELISDPKRWTAGTYAKMENGKPSFPLEKEAVSWCAIGAIIKVTRSISPTYDKAFIALDKAANFLYYMATSRVNDDLGHKAVLKMFDHAIAHVEDSDSTIVSSEPTLA